MVDARGQVAVHTGADCIPEAGHLAGDSFACQANMMARATVPEGMARAFTESDGDLADRLVAALHGAEAEGGDVRGRQSAALVVVAAEGEAWQKRVDLRVEDAADPLAELDRLLRLKRAHDLADEADGLMAAGQATEAGEHYGRASALAPESDELQFWAGLALVHAGEEAAGLDAVRRGRRRPPRLARAARSPVAGLRARRGAGAAGARRVGVARERTQRAGACRAAGGRGRG